MEKGPATPVFLERRSYRRRRMIDAQRMLPALGLILWMIPILWPSGSVDDVAGLRMSDAIIYVFGVWCMLIGLGGWLWWWLARNSDADDVQ